MTDGRELIPRLDLGDLEKATARCEQCGAELQRLQFAFKPCGDHPTARPLVTAPSSSLQTVIADVIVKPLSFLAVDNPFPADAPVTTDQVLSFCSGVPDPDGAAPVAKIVKRYKELHSGIRLQMVPKVEFIQDRIVEPLLQAQSSYMLGNFIGTIALCGIVCEMLSNLTWQIYSPDIRLNGKPVTTEMEPDVFRQRVEEMTQEKRINLLKAMMLISEETHSKFKAVLKIRNEYVHFHKAPAKKDTHQKQAAELFRLTQEIACDIIGQDFSNGRFNMTQGMFNFLQRNDLIKPVGNTESEPEEADKAQSE